jgi:DGQHR domain-containing protein
MTNNKISFPCLSVEQPIGTFYIGVIDASDLVAISFADVRRPEGRDIERYIGTQRDLSEGRVAEIKQYVTSVDASFPTSVILAVSSENAKYDEKRGTISIDKNENVAKIIDGQHRIAGLKDYSGNPPFHVNITIFIDMDIEDQAMVFATINLKQTKVTKSLAYDLYDYAQSRSPQKTCHNIAKLMNFKNGSPFYHRLKILGKATGLGTEVITQATFVDRMLKLITRDAMKDRDNIKRNKGLDPIDSKQARNLVLRGRFIDEKDAEIAKIIWNYFKAVEARWPQGWENLNPGFILARTTGFAALLRLFPQVWNDMGAPKDIPNVSAFTKYFNKSRLKDEKFTSDNYKPGSTGESALLMDLQKDIVGSIE